ncbi:helix-turn-helix domain-containing protein [Bacillus sp. FSL W8-0519]|uniref:helix-turn-helix domain-containing protein n=1 Tax=Bacillus TaxID=1386 RepID=UPI001E2C77BC|nr:helix-turn-helix domain-containing protein [Bacillus paranthracis]MBL3756650.1 helix-turn-helix domain-containing protein [Bacillus cereus]MCC2412266.1 helix-turn-helix domain-containing protein [Bacillus paranthracis]
MYKNFKDYPDVLNVSDIQGLLGIGRKQAYELVHSGEFHVINIGKRIKISKNVLISWMEGDNQK